MTFFINNILNQYNIFILIIITNIILYFLIQVNLRIKFQLFIIIFLIMSSFGFYLNLDGLMLFLILSECVLIFLFITLYTQLYTMHSNNYSNIKINFKIINLFIILQIYFNFYSLEPINFLNYYNSLNIITNSDFFIIYLFFFDHYKYISIFLVLILSLFSLFFVLLYFNLKLLTQDKLKTSLLVSILRKQSLINQSNYKINLRNFNN